MLAGGSLETEVSLPSNELQFHLKGNEGRRGSAKKNTYTAHKLGEMEQDPGRIPAFASSLSLKSKSAKFFDEERETAKKESKKQAWAPKSKLKQLACSSDPQFAAGGKGGSLELRHVVVTQQRHEGKLFGRAEDHIYLRDLIKLRDIFREANSKGDGTIKLEEFLVIFDKLFSLNGKNQEEILTFFNKIDYNCDGSICWSDFCTYMQLELQERDDVAVTSKMVEFRLPAETIAHNPHKDSVCRVSHLNDGMMVTCSEDGVVCFWSHDFKPRRTRKAEFGLTGKPKWITDMALCKTINKILLTTGDHEIQFYEMMNFEPYCQLRKLESVPLRMDFWSNPENHDECIILIGDTEGTVTVIKTSNIKEAFKYWKRGAKADNGMPTYSVEKLVTEKIAGTSVHRWKLHNNWVSEIHFIPSLRSFVSCSCDKDNSVVMGTPSGSTPVDFLLQSPWQYTSPTLDKGDESQDATSFNARPRNYLIAKHRSPGDQRVFRVPKGVSTLDYCAKSVILATGGLDQIIRLWNPFIVSKPVAKLYGQNSPVFRVQVDSFHDRVYSIGNDNTVNVWHLLDHTCLFTVIPSLHKLSSPVECFYYNPVVSCLVLAAEHQIAVLNMASSRGVRMDIVQTHLHPVTAVKYSHCFRQVITSCEGAVVKVWDISSGKNVFEFGADMGKDVGIRAMDVDRAGKRIVTGGENGVIKLWNYSNGQCVRVLDKGSPLETTDIKFINLNDHKYIIATGWDRKIHLFPDLPGRHVHHVLKPVEGWTSYSANGHSEDILSVAVGISNMMATSSFDGEVILWSVVSCHMFSRLKVPVETSTKASTKPHGPAIHEDRAVHRVLFLESRVQQAKTAATLVASGPYGKIHFWNVYEGARPMGVFRACRSSCISDMAIDDTNSILIAADTQGYVDIFNIKNFCVSKNTMDAPRKIALWRAHTQRITCLAMIDSWNILITGSVDGAVRLWTLQGQYIGTFGQDQLWTLGDPSTYQHPLIPEDILLDKSSLIELLNTGDLEACESPTSSSEEIQDVSKDSDASSEDLRSDDAVEDVEASEVAKESENVMIVSEVKAKINEEDELIHSHVSMEVPSYNSSKVGKRLRHLRTHSAIKKDEAKSKAVYCHLPYQPLSNELCYQLQPPAESQRSGKVMAGICTR